MTKYRYLPAGLIAFILLLLFAFPAPAVSTAPQLTSLSVTVDGTVLDFGFTPMQTDYTITLDSTQAVAATVNATTADGNSVKMQVGRSEKSLPQTVSLTLDSTTPLTITVTDNVDKSTVYKLIFIVQPTREAVTGPNNGGNSTGNDTASESNKTDPATDNDECPVVTPTNVQPVAPPSTGDSAPPSSYAGNQPANELGNKLTDEMLHLIMYINAPFYFINDKYQEMDAAPYLVTDTRGGYTMVPVRFVAESLGAHVTWTASSKTVGIDLSGQHFELVIGQLVPGTPVAACIRGDRTYVPLRYVMESFGAMVFWTQAEKRIDIYFDPA